MIDICLYYQMTCDTLINYENDKWHIKLKRLDNDIKTKSISKTSTNELKEKQKLSAHGAEQSNAKPTRPKCLRYPHDPGVL